MITKHLIHSLTYDEVASTVGREKEWVRIDAKIKMKKALEKCLNSVFMRKFKIDSYVDSQTPGRFEVYLRMEDKDGN